MDGINISINISKLTIIMEQNLGAMICHDMPYWPCERLPGTTTSWNLDISQSRLHVTDAERDDAVAGCGARRCGGKRELHGWNFMFLRI